MLDTSSALIASAALNKILEIKRYKLKEEYSYMLDNANVSLLNSEIFARIGVDIFSLQNEEDVNAYEVALQRKIREVLNLSSREVMIREEIKFLETVKPYSGKDISKIAPLVINARLKKTMSLFNINALSITAMINNPLATWFVDIDGVNTREFLVLSKFVFRMIDVYVLFIISETRVDKMLVKDSFFYRPNNRYIGDVPRLFLQGINHYGREFSINNERSKFMNSTYVSGLSIEPEKLIRFSDAKLVNEGTSINFRVSNTISGTNLYFVYALDFIRLSHDANKRNYL